MKDPIRSTKSNLNYFSYERNVNCRKWWDTQARVIRGSSSHSASKDCNSNSRTSFSPLKQTGGLLTPKFMGLRLILNYCDRS
jgi:hypothetical protein